MAKNDISDRFIKAFEQLIKDSKVSDKKDFAASIDVSPSMITEISKGRSSVGTTAVQNIVKKYNISADWLLTGNGPMLKSELSDPSHPSPSVSSGKSAPSGQTEEITKRKGIPLIPLEAVAGFPAAESESVYLEDCEVYDVPEFDEKGANFMIRASGDSMIPRYYNGDIMACRKIKDVKFFQWGEIYVLETNQGTLIKRVQPVEDHDDCILCVSENATIFKPFIINKNDIRSVSTIVGFVRLE